MIQYAMIINSIITVSIMNIGLLGMAAIHRHNSNTKHPNLNICILLPLESNFFISSLLKNKKITIFGV